MSINSNLPIMAIIIPFTATFIIGLIKEKYINLKRLISVIGCFLSLIVTFMMIKPIFIDNKIIEYWMGGSNPTLILSFRIWFCDPIPVFWRWLLFGADPH